MIFVADLLSLCIATLTSVFHAFYQLLWFLLLPY